MLEILAWNLRHRLNNDDAEEMRTKVRALFDSLSPKSLEERILFFVKNVPYGFADPERDDTDEFDANAKRAAKLGLECANQWSVFIKVVDRLSRVETKEGFAFGKALLSNYDSPVYAMRIALDALEAAHDGKQDPSLAGGMLYALFERDRISANEFIIEVSQKQKLRNFLPYFVSLHVTSEGLGLITEALGRKELAPDSLHILGVGRVLSPLPVSEIKNFLLKVKRSSAEAQLVAIDLMGMYIFANKEMFKELRTEIEEVLTSNVIFSRTPNRSMINHHYETLAKALLEDREFGERFSVFIAKSLIEAGEKGGGGDTYLLQNLAKLVLQQYTRTSLPIFASHIENSGDEDRWTLSHILGAPFSFSGKDSGAIFNLDIDALLDACRKFPKHFAPFIAEIAPLFPLYGEARKLSELGRALLDEFGSRDEILKAFSINIGTGSWTGPISAHLRSFLPPLLDPQKHKRSQVRTWAREKLKQITQQIEREEKNEEEDSLREN